MSLTYAEILNQPSAWKQAVEQTPARWQQMMGIVGADPMTHALFMGSGTSLYIAQTAAQSFMEVTGITASAIPTSEAFLSDASTVPRSGLVVAFIISRSGTTSEAHLAAKHLRQHHPHVQTVGVTCNTDTELASLTDACIELPFASEQSVVMTQSFTTMLLALQAVAAMVDGDARLLEELARLPAEFEKRRDESERLARHLGEVLHFDKTIFLGLGPNQGLAEEGTLKLKEMTQSHCEAYNPLEFRHGPISIVDEHTLIILLEGTREQPFLADVERDLRQHEAHVVAIGPHNALAANERLVIGQDFGDLARCVLYMPVLQLFAYYRALTLGLDPDSPRNLDPVVVLDGH